MPTVKNKIKLEKLSINARKPINAACNTDVSIVTSFLNQDKH
jgi:hypothetical protein